MANSFIEDYSVGKPMEDRNKDLLDSSILSEILIAIENGNITLSELREQMARISCDEIINKGIDEIIKSTKLKGVEKNILLKDILSARNQDYINNNTEIIEDILNFINNSQDLSDKEKDINCADIFRIIKKQNATIDFSKCRNRELMYLQIKDNKELTDFEKELLFIYSYSTNSGKDSIKMLESLEGTSYYMQLVHAMYGRYIKFDSEDKLIIIPAIKAIILSNQASYSIDEVGEIIANQYKILKIILSKRAENILKDGLGVTINKKELDAALLYLNRPLPKTHAAIEFEMIPDSRLVGLDTQYTVSVSTSVQRVHSLAGDMNNNSPHKKVPDFSVKDKESKIILKVLHPHDKKALLMGYKSKCCFRPNGIADESARSKYSLLKYTTTTPYGGVLECGNEISNDEVGNEIFMASPFLVNGNMLMIHSYETENDKKRDVVNSLLVKGAIKAIEESRGKSNLKCVMITDLHKGRLDENGKIAIGCKFKPYFEGEYAKYEGMYTNLKDLGISHYVLAAEVDGVILTGDNLVDFFKKECQGNPKIFSEKVGLREGEIDYDYDYGYRQNNERIEIKGKKTFQLFFDKYIEKKGERDALALANRRILLLENFAKLDENEKKKYEKEIKELEYINMKLEEYDEEHNTNILGLHKKEIAKRLKDSLVEMINLYRGDNFDLLLEGIGLSKEKLEELVDLRVERELEDYKKGSKTVCTSKDTGKLKKMMSALIGEVKKRRLKDELINSIKNGTLDENDYLFMKESGISEELIDRYKNAYLNSKDRDEDTIQKGRIITKKKQLKKKYMSNDRRILDILIVEDYLKPEITDDMIIGLINKKTILTVKNMFDAIKAEGNIPLNEEQEVDNIIHIEDVLNELKHGAISENSQIVLDSIKNEYGIDILEIWSEKNDRNQIEQELKLNYFTKIKSQITVDFDSEERMKRIIMSINPNAKSDVYDKIDYGLSWYICSNDITNSFDCFIGENASEEEQDQFLKILESRIGNETDSKKSSVMKKAYAKIHGIDEGEVLEYIASVSNEVKAGDRKKMLERLSKERNTGRTVPGV